MSWEEDYLMRKSREFDKRLTRLEKEAGLKWDSENGVYEDEKEVVKEKQESGEEEDSDSYNDWNLTQLKEEIDARNVDRDEEDKLSKNGNKADLVAALELDDEEQDKTDG